MAQVWVTNTLGGYAYSDNLSHKLRTELQPSLKYRQFCDAKDAVHQGLHKGATFHWNVYSDVVTQGTSLVETNVMPETNFTITQGTMTINEFGNSVAHTGKLDDLSEQPITEIIKRVLKNDAKKALDGEAAAQFSATPLRVSPTAGTSTTAITVLTTGTATDTTTVEMNKEHVKAIVDEMKERDIPGYMGDDYYAIGRPRTFRNFKDDMEAIHQYVETGFGMIMNGETGRYEGTRFVEQTAIAKGTNSTAAAEWGTSDTVHFFGEDNVAEAIAIPEEIRGKIPTDFGRSKGVAWYYLGGFGIVHTAAAQARILMWDSAA